LPETVPVTFTVNVQLLFAGTLAAEMETLPVPATAVATPPQVLATPFGVATTIPAGSASVNATPVKPTVFAAGFVTVNVNEVDAFNAMLAAPNAFAIAGGATTAILADAVPPVPPCVEVTAPVVLFCAPAAIPVTFTVKLQDALAASVPLDKLTLAEPATPVAVPPQVLVSPFGVATTSPAGNVSVNAIPVSDKLAFGLLTVIVSEVPPFSGIVAAPNAFAIVGGAATVTDAFEVFPAPAVVELTVTLLFFTPPVVPVTFTLKLHDPLAANVAPARLTLPDPAKAVIVPPPQVPARPFGAATTNPAGNVSVNATPVCAVVASGLFTTKVKEVDPPSATLAAPKAFVTAAAVTTAKFADAVFPVPPLVEETAPLTFARLPEAVPVTLIANVHALLTAILAAEIETLPEPATAVTTPPQVLAAPFGVATTIPAGSVSVNATPVSATVFAAGFVIVNVNEVLLFVPMLAAPNAFAMEGGPITVMLAEAPAPVPPSVEPDPPETLFSTPAAVPVTFTPNVHDAFAASVAPDMITLPDPALAKIDPLGQDPVIMLGEETCSPAGKVSPNPTPVRAVPVFGFVMVKLSVVVP
jgi:hypothetical protein